MRKDKLFLTTILNGLEFLDSMLISRDLMMQKLLEKGIAARRGVMAIHMEECYRKYKVSLPETERITRNTILLPIYPSMSREEQEYVVRWVEQILG